MKKKINYTIYLKKLNYNNNNTKMIKIVKFH